MPRCPRSPRHLKGPLLSVSLAGKILIYSRLGRIVTTIVNLVRTARLGECDGLVKYAAKSIICLLGMSSLALLLLLHVEVGLSSTVIGGLCRNAYQLSVASESACQLADAILPSLY